jgi:hypothetical protein
MFALNFHFFFLSQTILMISDIRLHEESLFRGDIFVWDLESLSVKHLAKLATPHTKKVLMASQVSHLTTPHTKKSVGWLSL